jgi:AraC family transcriptional regulator, exoenzyme S synthesis regulatory protein ExsA
MFNLYDFVSDSRMFKKFKVDDLLFVEYHCVIEETKFGYWTPNNYFIYILTGKKKWKSLDKEYIVDAGDALFIKKGAYIAHQFFDEKFCSLLIFLPDEFIKKVMQNYQIHCPQPASIENSESIIQLEVDDILSTYFHSVLNYFPQSAPPPAGLLKVKFEELIISVLSGTKNRPLAGYFNEVCANSKISIREIMEANFAYNMKLEEFAKLSGRSLSTFRRDFETIYNTSPSKWLTQRRLEYGKYLLETTDKNISEITFESGFENPSHFIRVFKENFGTSPLRYKSAPKI